MRSTAFLSFLLIFLQLANVVLPQGCELVGGPCNTSCAECQNQCGVIAQAGYDTINATYEKCASDCADAFPDCYDGEGQCDDDANACGDACNSAYDAEVPGVGQAEVDCYQACVNSQQGCIQGYLLGRGSGSGSSGGSASDPSCSVSGSSCQTIGCGNNPTVQSWCGSYSTAVQSTCNDVSGCGASATASGICANCAGVIYGRCVSYANNFVYTTTGSTTSTSMLVKYCKASLAGGPPNLEAIAKTCPALVEAAYGPGSTSC